MTKNVDWMFDVLSDLESFSNQNALVRVAEKIVEAKLLLNEETVRMHEFGQEQTTARSDASS